MRGIHRVRTNQPPCVTGIDWSNPITRDLHHAMTFAEGAKAYVATRLGTYMSDGIHTYSTAVRPGKGKSGVFSTANATSWMGVNTGPQEVPTTNVFSVLFVCRETSAGGASAGRIWTNVGKGFFASGAFQAIANNGGTWSVPFSLNADHCGIYTANVSAITPVHTCMIDGITQTITLVTGGTAAQAFAGPFVWGNNATTAGIRVFAGEITLGIVARRIWTPTEMASLSANPWQVFMPPRRPILVPTKQPQLAPILAQ